ncbi:hypothetical protein D3C86_1236080 [compost metagenome]
MAGFQVVPPSVDTCRVSPAPRGADRLPRIRRPALPSLVRKSLSLVPLSLPRAVSVAVCVGAVVSTVKPNGSDGALVLPARSMAATVMRCGPSLSAVAGVNVQWPEASACTRPISTPSSYTTTVLLASAVPVKPGRVSSVVAPSAIWGVTMLPTSSATDTMTGACGGVVSTTKSQALLASLVWPSGLVDVAVMWRGPSGSAVVGVNVQRPLASAITSPRKVVPS